MGFFTNLVLCQLLINGIAWFQNFLSTFPCHCEPGNYQLAKGYCGPSRKNTESRFIHPTAVVSFKGVTLKYVWLNYATVSQYMLETLLCKLSSESASVAFKHLHPHLCSQKIRNQNDLRPLNRKKWKIKNGRARAAQFWRNCLTRHIYLLYYRFLYLIFTMIIKYVSF